MCVECYKTDRPQQLVPLVQVLAIYQWFGFYKAKLLQFAEMQLSFTARTFRPDSYKTWYELYDYVIDEANVKTSARECC